MNRLHLIIVCILLYGSIGVSLYMSFMGINVIICTIIPTIIAGSTLYFLGKNIKKKEYIENNYDGVPGRTYIGHLMFIMHEHAELVYDANPDAIVYTEETVLFLLETMRQRTLENGRNEPPPKI